MESVWYHAWKEAQESHVASWKGLYILSVETLHGQEDPAMASKKPARTSLPMSDCSSHPDPDPEATFFFLGKSLYAVGAILPTLPRVGFLHDLPMMKFGVNSIFLGRAVKSAEIIQVGLSFHRYSFAHDKLRSH